MPERGWLIWIGSALMVGGAVVLASYSWTLHERDVAQRLARERLNTITEPHRPAPPAPVRHGDVIGELDIPRLQLSVMVFEGDDAGILSQGAGHIPGTALASGSGNIGIAAHRDTYFRPLRAVQTNDVIALKTPAGTSRYAVTDAKTYGAFRCRRAGARSRARPDAGDLLSVLFCGKRAGKVHRARAEDW